ncbi:alpha/beta hydrolase [Saccharomonospora sp. NPDC006951]
MTTAAPPTRYLDLAHGRIAYDDTADTADTGTGTGARVVVCVPGLGDIRGVYRHLRPLLTGAGYRVVTMDLRGAGESSAPWPDYSTTAVASDVLALVRHLDAGPVVLLGNSYTGGASLVAAAEAGEDFAGLVLTAPFARRRPRERLLVRLALTVVGRSPFAWVAYWSSLFTGGKPADFAAAKKALRASLREPGHMAALRSMLAAGQAPGEAAAPQVRCPVLVVMGDADPDFPDPAVEADAVANLVPDGTVAVIEGCGHYPAAEAPGETAAVVLPFLRKVMG